MASTIVNPHEKMRGRDVAPVARGEQAPRPPREPGAGEDAPPPPPEGASVELRTAPCDFRFPTQTQTRHCYVRYLEYHRCMKAKGGDKPECEQFQRYYRLSSGIGRGRKGYFQDRSDPSGDELVRSTSCSTV